MISHGFSTVRYQNTFGLDLATNAWVDKTPGAGMLDGASTRPLP